MYSNYYKIILIIYIPVIINNVNFELLRQPTVVISKGVTPTVFYWLNKQIGNVLNPTRINKKDLYTFNSIILVRYDPFNILLDLINLKRKSKKIILLIFGILLFNCNISTAEKVSINKQLIGVVGAVSGTVKTETRDLKTGDKIYLNETISAGAASGTQILLLDQSTFTIGEDSEVVMDTFIYDPATNDGKIVASVKQGSLKVISGLISKKNPDSLTVEVPEGTLGSRGTEFQTIVSKGKTDTLLIGPGKNNTLGMRPGAVLVGNSLGQTLLDNPYSVTSMTKGKAPGQARKITKNQFQNIVKYT